MFEIEKAMYDNGLLSNVNGGSLHPGGSNLSDHLLDLCNLPLKARVLDIGCGSGETVGTLQKNGSRASGIDNHVHLLRAGLHRNPNLQMICGLGTALPIANDIIDTVLAECSLSVISNFDGVLAEIRRVLRIGGKLAITDIYCHSTGASHSFHRSSVQCGMQHALTKDELFSLLRKHGFEILVWEDHSETLKHLAAQMILTYGSVCEFWRKSEPDINPSDIQDEISKVRPGYYLLIAQKT